MSTTLDLNAADLDRLRRDLEGLRREIGAGAPSPVRRRGVLAQAGATAELLCKLIARRHGIERPGRQLDLLNLDDLINVLAPTGFLPVAMRVHLRTIQAWRNVATHDKVDGAVLDDAAVHSVEAALFAVIRWFVRDELGEPVETWGFRTYEPGGLEPFEGQPVWLRGLAIVGVIGLAVGAVDLGPLLWDRVEAVAVAAFDLPVCGDGVVEAREACDDGNEVGTDACTANCEPNAVFAGGARPGGGAWEMGSATACDLHEDLCPLETPATPVLLGPFWVMRNEVTVEALRAWAPKAGVSLPNAFALGMDVDPRLPASMLDFDEARAVCRAMGGDLPNEAQWEYVARQNGQDAAYPWGEDDPHCGLAVLGEHTCSHGHASAVCSRPAGNTPSGVCDLAGNVFEWVGWAFVDAGFDPSGELPSYPGRRPTTSGQEKYYWDADALRGEALPVQGLRGGGHWHTLPFFNRSRSRYAIDRKAREANIGFRCVFPTSAFVDRVP
jgi:cysteine-rich repeat protein